ncbi:MAG: hypothetical protein U0165_13875 [Polyangiaceae bacterium]
MRTSLEWNKSTRRWLGRGVLATAVASLSVAACGDIPIANEIPPAGNILGTVVYSGPKPCTQNGHVVGAAVLLLFNEMLLPPPEGLGTTAASLAVVAGDKLFEGIMADLPSSTDPDAIACPDPSEPPVSVSADFTAGPLRAGAYQIRGFYDYDNNFSPILRTQSLPTAGDVGGGALENPAAALAGAKPIYSRIVIGNEDEKGNITLPPTGARVDNVTVSLGKQLTWGRPIYYWNQVFDGKTELTDQKTWVMAQDRRLALPPKANPTIADTLFLRVKLGAGVPEAEIPTAEAAPFGLQAGPPYNKFVFYPNRDADGNIIPILEIVQKAFTANVDGQSVSVPVDGIPVADMFPQVVFARLDAADKNDLTTIASPAVTLSGLVVVDNLVSTNSNSIEAALASSETPGYLLRDELEVYVRPSVACLNPLDPETHIFLVTPGLFATNDSETDPLKRAIVFPEDLKPKLVNRFKQYMHGTDEENLARVHVVEGCLPGGNYSLNTLYDTGQSWTGPNEAGHCQSPEVEGVDSAGKPICSQPPLPSRAQLISQQARLRIEGYTNGDSSYCANIHTTNRGDKTWTTVDDNGNKVEKKFQFIDGVPTVCLTAGEIAKNSDRLVE